jgi:hypothetical protein
MYKNLSAKGAAAIPNTATRIGGTSVINIQEIPNAVTPSLFLTEAMVMMHTSNNNIIELNRYIPPVGTLVMNGFKSKGKTSFFIENIYETKAIFILKKTG